MKDNVVIDKSYAFALKVVRLYLSLKENKKEYELSRQVLKSGTSIAANIEEVWEVNQKKTSLPKSVSLTRSAVRLYFGLSF